MKKIFYFSLVNWHTIKQRPQFIAEELASNFEVHYYTIKTFGKKFISKNNINSSNLSLHYLYKIPYLKTYNIINIVIINIQLKILLKYYDMFWTNGNCEIYNSLFKKKSNNLIIYDCLDDQLEFPRVKANKKLAIKVKEGESSLLEKADIVFCSSETLKNTLLSRYKINRKIHLINNGIYLYKNKFDDSCKFIQNINKVITYIGTISEWFDFDLLLKLCNENDKIEFHLYGPKKVDIPNSNRISYFGIIEHNRIFEIMVNSDALIMPFEVNELVESVNPVKLYEYIYTGKIVFAKKYNETKKFEKYVYLYDNYSELNILVKKLTANEIKPKATIEEARSFAENNTWHKRFEKITNIINSY